MSSTRRNQGEDIKVFQFSNCEDQQASALFFMLNVIIFNVKKTKVPTEPKVDQSESAVEPGPSLPFGPDGCLKAIDTN